MFKVPPPITPRGPPLGLRSRSFELGCHGCLLLYVLHRTLFSGFITLWEIVTRGRIPQLSLLETLSLAVATRSCFDGRLAWEDGAGGASHLDGRVDV